MENAPVRLASVQRFFQRNDRLAPRESHEIGQFLQRTVEPRRRHFEPLVIDIFNRQNVLELTSDLFTVLDRDTGGLIDIDAKHAAPGTLEIDQLVAHARDRGFYQFRQLHKCPLRYSRATRTSCGPRAWPAHGRSV